MGLKLATPAVVTLITLACGRDASADNKDLAQQLFQLGLDEYRAKQYDAAVLSMKKSYALDARPDALYAMAQAERQNGNCKDALVHYELLLQTSKDQMTAEAVKGNVELCHQIEAGKEPAVDPKADPKKTEAQDAPVLQIRTVYRTERKTDALGITLFAGGGIALGGAFVLYMVARSTRNDADRATSLEEYDDRFDRAASLRQISYISAGVGIGLVGFATFRLIRGRGRPESREIAVVPIRGGSMVSWSTPW